MRPLARNIDKLRAGMEKGDITVALHGLQIAAHAMQQGMTLVSHGRVFGPVPG